MDGEYFLYDKYLKNKYRNVSKNITCNYVGFYPGGMQDLIHCSVQMENVIYNLFRQIQDLYLPIFGKGKMWRFI